MQAVPEMLYNEERDLKVPGVDGIHFSSFALPHCYAVLSGSANKCVGPSCGFFSSLGTIREINLCLQVWVS